MRDPDYRPKMKPLSFEELDRERRYHQEDLLIERLDMIVVLLKELVQRVGR